MALCFALFFVWNHFQNQSFDETFYRVFSQKINEPVRAVYLSDAHQVRFGEKNEKLLEHIRSLEPDIILLGGDLLNDVDPDVDYVIELCQKLVQIAPVFYGLGNHENKVIYDMDLYKDQLEEAGIEEGTEDFSDLVVDRRLLDGLEQCGVTVLQNADEEIEVNGNRILIGGVSTNVDSFWPYSGKFYTAFDHKSESTFKILLSHFPGTVTQYLDDSTVDLALAGHLHGGIVRIPGLGGLKSADEGYFPEYDAGKFQIGNTQLIVGRGLGNHGAIPRILNKPEIVIVDLF